MLAVAATKPLLLGPVPFAFPLTAAIVEAPIAPMFCLPVCFVSELPLIVAGMFWLKPGAGCILFALVWKVAD